MPRVITTINSLKPSKQDGEESFPFDLCFSEFESNVKLLTERFKYFYDNFEYKSHITAGGEKCWQNKQINMICNHDLMPSPDEFKQRYDNRIKNLYTTLKNNSKYLFFLVATKEPIESKFLDLFFKEVSKYRDIKTFKLIIINQSEQKMSYRHKHLYCIDLSKDKLFAEIDKTHEWVGVLKQQNTFNALLFNYKICKKISKTIKKCIRI